MSKRMIESEKLIDKTKLYSLEEAVKILKQTKKAKFDETVEISIRLGIDPKQTDQTVRGAVSLPHGIGKTKRVVVIAKGEKIKEAESAGADFFGSEDIMEKISKGWLDFDAIIATPDAMKDLAKLGKILGPRGLMPNPKTGTVTFDIAKTVKEIKAGRVEFKNDTQGIVHTILGKISFDENKLIENAKTVITAIASLKPSSSKGQYIKTIAISSTMGPGIRINTSVAQS
ncbi:MAG: 50S ribosomal protein L1 [Elusimicrobia bacterium RIFOXYC2_FULL_34_12]|nr:MAG: 50S ribosomal protein L1 [Elusimicrobia bacterium RIFOXYC2_FULL_34_12]OGS39060.1 MAG: 50S ribosomal protein L1 [Elusimicrobia bacterium RIFOXYD2_FULL_34_30]HAM39200.1 50S ribosomal protein L1 [Elusimicrobiota bacterium]